MVLVPRFCFLVLLLGCALARAQTTAPHNGSDAGDQTAQPPPLRTTVTVTEKVTAETPASLVVLDQQQVTETPGVNLDDKLRDVPGFSLFRRTSSMVANPTTQGVSLRAIGSTGASRTLVLWDGVPLNDPFGGWIYWTRVDPNYIDRVEIVRGANTAIFGYQALGGAIGLFSPPVQRNHALFSYYGGNQGSEELAGGYSTFWGKFGLSANVRAFTSDGYYIIPSNLRGSSDNRANVRFVAGTLHLDYLGLANRLNLRFDTLAEARHNGTQLQNNSTGLGTVSANYNHAFAKDRIAAIAYHSREQFHSTFSAVAAARNSERLTSRQTVPAEDLGGGAYWAHHEPAWNTIVGADVDDAHGTSFDTSYPAVVLVKSGGTILQHGIFAQGDIGWGRARFYAGIRHQFTGLGGTFVSPNAGATVGLGNFRLRASGYRSERTPTLNELYRQFRVGNVLTLANPALVPERLVGVEAGLDWSNEGSRFSVTLFHDDLTNLILNSTLSASPTQILRQRKNAANGLSRGLESSYSYRWRNWTADANYLFADARLSAGPRLAQVPKQQGTGGLTYSHNGTLVSFGVRAFGLQFDDDVNQFLLPGYASLQLSAQQRLVKSWYAQATVENLLDRQFLVALTPTPNIGAPRLWRLGLRWNGTLR